MVIMNDIEWPMLSYYVIYYESFKKVTSEQRKKLLEVDPHFELHVGFLEVFLYMSSYVLHYVMRNGSPMTFYQMVEMPYYLLQRDFPVRADQHTQLGHLPSNGLAHGAVRGLTLLHYMSISKNKPKSRIKS